MNAHALARRKNDSLMARKPSGLRPLWVLLIASTLAATAPVGVLAALLPRPAFPGPPPLAVESVSISPNPPAAYSPVTVTARVSRGGSVSAGLGYVASFGATLSGGTSMSPRDPRTFDVAIGPFGPGTEVWFVVGVSTSTESARSDYTIFQVGTVLRGGPSNLRIAVAPAPGPPVPGGTIVISANVTTDATSSEAFLQAIVIRSGVAFGMSFRMDQSGPSFTAFLFEYPASLIAYRVVAQDDTGNTAVTPTNFLDVPDYPGPVP